MQRLESLEKAPWLRAKPLGVLCNIFRHTANERFDLMWITCKARTRRQMVRFKIHRGRRLFSLTLAELRGLLFWVYGFVNKDQSMGSRMAANASSAPESNEYPLQRPTRSALGSFRLSSDEGRYMEQVQVILADPLPVVLSGFRNFMEEHPRIRVVGEATTLTAFEEVLAANTGCVAIVDWRMTSLESAMRMAKKSRLILCAIPDGLEVRRHALRAGVHGFIGKDQSAADIRRAVLTVASGQIWIGKTTAEAILEHELSVGRAQSVTADRLRQLTTRERQVIQMACQGLKSRAIARALRISEPTVAHHLTSIYAKLQVKDRIGLIIYAFRHSLQLGEINPPIPDKFDSFQVPGLR